MTPLVEILEAASGGKENSSTTLGTTATGSVRTLDTGVSGGIGLQLLYNVLLVIWQLSFEASLVGDDLESYDKPSPTTPFMVDVFR